MDTYFLLMEISSTAGVCHCRVPFSHSALPSCSSLILCVFCRMTNEGFLEDFLLCNLKEETKQTLTDKMQVT